MKYITKTGKVLTDEDIERLADEAERGYDVTKMPHHWDKVELGPRRPLRCQATTVTIYPGSPTVQCYLDRGHDDARHRARNPAYDDAGPRLDVMWYDQKKGRSETIDVTVKLVSESGQPLSSWPSRRYIVSDGDTITLYVHPGDIERTWANAEGGRDNLEQRVRRLLGFQAQHAPSNVQGGRRNGAYKQGWIDATNMILDIISGRAQ